MRRRDWKIKNLERNIFGKFKTKKRFFFLRKLALRKHKTLIKRNLIPNFFFLSNFFFNFKKLKQQQINYIFSTNKNNFIFLPDFTFKKKINNLFIIFKKIQKKFNFQFFIEPKKSNYFGFNLNIIKLYDEKLLNNFLLEDGNKNIISKKFLNIEMDCDNFLTFNFFFNFNLNLNNFLEIYKIIVILFLINSQKIIKKYIYEILTLQPILLDLKKKLLVIILQIKNLNGCLSVKKIIQDETTVVKLLI